MVSDNGFVQYKCYHCGHGGAGNPGQKYPCHRCGHKYMTPRIKTTKSTSQNLEKPSET